MNIQLHLIGQRGTFSLTVGISVTNYRPFTHTCTSRRIQLCSTLTFSTPLCVNVRLSVYRKKVPLLLFTKDVM